MDLTPKQMECLRALATFQNIAPWAPRASEVSGRAGHTPRWAIDKLNALERRGLVRITNNVAPWTWRITDAGRDALNTSD